MKNALHTRLCDMLDIKYPIILAGMGGMGGPTSGPELVAAVSNAGGLGVLGCAFLSPRKIDEMIRKTKSLTDKPFGVDTIIPPEVPQTGTTAEFQAGLPSLAPSAATDEPDVIEKLRMELGVPLPSGGRGYLANMAEDAVCPGRFQAAGRGHYRAPGSGLGCGFGRPGALCKRVTDKPFGVDTIIPPGGS